MHCGSTVEAFQERHLMRHSGSTVDAFLVEAMIRGRRVPLWRRVGCDAAGGRGLGRSAECQKSTGTAMQPVAEA
eukprot:3571772-Heterocapsa_arctica.AAC.1